MAVIGYDVEECELPFAQAVTDLKERSGMSFRELARAVSDSGPAMSPSYLSALANGFARPSLKTIRRVAAAFDKQPRYFAEYRLAQWRSLLDEGFDSGVAGALAVVREMPPQLHVRALEQNPEDAPNAVPYRSGPAARSRAR